MYCGLGVNRTQFHKNMGVTAVFTDIFKNGKQQVSLKGYGYWVWKNMISYRELAGNGRALMAT